MAGPIGEVILGAPSAAVMEVTFVGRAAHAGIAPEDGRSAIAAAGRAIADMRLGRIDEVTSANVGTIEGGVARNIVPARCTFSAEARSHDERKLSGGRPGDARGVRLRRLADRVRGRDPVDPGYKGYRFRKEDEPVRLARAALERTGHEPVYSLCGGGADANVFNLRGLACVNLSNGMADIHSPTSTSRSPTSRRWWTSRSRSSRKRVPLSLRRGVVTAVHERHEGLARVEVDGQACVAYPQLTGPVALGDEVVVNTQARDLGLGSGGFDVLYVNLTRGLGLPAEPGAHVMKLRIRRCNSPRGTSRRRARRRPPSTGCPWCVAPCTARSCPCSRRSRGSAPRTSSSRAERSRWRSPTPCAR